MGKLLLSQYAIHPMIQSDEVQSTDNSENTDTGNAPANEEVV